MPASHGKQKRAEKQKKRREVARKKEQARRADLVLPAKADALIQRAVSFPFGPSFISNEWQDTDEDAPELVSVVVTRRAPSGLFIPAVALVDRTCVGVKNGLVGAPVTESALVTFLDDVGRAHGGMETCELLVAQSVVFHALDYARSLGFAPHRDFPAALFGPRPAELVETPLARPSRPVFIAGPYDNATRILAQLKRVVGSDFSYTTAVDASFADVSGALDEGDDDDSDDEEEEEQARS